MYKFIIVKKGGGDLLVIEVAEKEEIFMSEFTFSSIFFCKTQS